METTKVALENERKIQQLQMQAINALWKKVSTLQPQTNGSSEMSVSTSSLTGNVEANPTAVVQDLAKTCTVLTNQVCWPRHSHFLHIVIITLNFPVQ